MTTATTHTHTKKVLNWKNKNVTLYSIYYYFICGKKTKKVWVHAQNYYLMLSVNIA